MLGEILRRRGIRSVTWFHADHWEPWGQGINETTLKRLESFTRQVKASPFARKMTLFYLTGTNYRLKSASDNRDGEIVQAQSRSERDHDLARQIIGELRSQTDVEFQVHLHHEHLVDNDGSWGDLHNTIKSKTDPEQDANRLHYMLRTELGTLRHDTGAALDSWAFVHGMWALNGSDRAVCRIDNEIEILMKHGCWGDFTFPAARGHCDPTILEQPYTCMPFKAAKGYDDPRSEPIALDVGAGAIRDGRFLIWNSKAKHDVCSVDCYTVQDLSRVTRANQIVLTWLANCPVINGILYIKTHAHSMHADYYQEGSRVPLTGPHVVPTFDLLQHACEDARVELTYASVSEVFDTLRKLDSRVPISPTTPASAALLLDAPLRVTSAGGTTGNSMEQSDFSHVNLFAVSTLQRWLEADPRHKRAAGDYYSARLAQGRLFVEPELAIAEYSRKYFDKGAHFFELGFGFGELSLLLALSGFRATGFESDNGRHEGAAALVAALEGGGVVSSGLSLVCGAFPDALQLSSLDADGESIFVSTNVTSTHVMEKMTYINRSLRLFDHLIIDLARFGKVRDEQSQHELTTKFAELGFVEVAQVYVTGGADIRHFERRQLGDRIAEPVPPRVNVDDVRYSDLGSAVPRRLLRTPLHIFKGMDVATDALFPRLALVPHSWLPTSKIRIANFPSPFQPLDTQPPAFREGMEPGSGSFVFDRFGGHLVSCSYGVFKCLMLDPNVGSDQQAIDIFRFASANIMHSCIDKPVILPWAKRFQYVRPDLLLNKLFLSDQPLGLHCDHAAQVTAYLLHLSGYQVREVGVIDPAINSGHVVMEVYLPEQARWVMLDPDFGVVVANRAGALVGTSEIVACTNREQELEVRRVVEKRWASGGLDVPEAHSGQLSWNPSAPMGEQTVRDDSYYRMMDRFFRVRRECAYRFEDGFADNRLDAADGKNLGAASSNKLLSVSDADSSTEALRHAETKYTVTGQVMIDSRVQPQGKVPWSKQLHDLFVPILQHRIERSGVQESGAYNFYSVRLQRGDFFSDYELALTRKFLSSGLGIRQIHEIGSGFGQLMFLLGWNGFKTVGFEADRARARTARDLRAILNLVDPELTANVKLVEAEFPSREAPKPEADSLVLTTNLVATRSLSQQLSTLEEMRKYPFVLADVQRFFEYRPDPAEEQQALSLFSQAGFAEPELFLDLGSSGRYYLFTNSG